MNFLTQKQKTWIVRKTIKVGGLYRFPSFGFTVYAEPNYLSGERIDTNPFTKSLEGEMFIVKDIQNGFCRGNFERKPKFLDMYLTEEELSRRDLIEVLFLFTISFIPLVVYNKLAKKV
jgi:hypothetical protein